MRCGLDAGIMRKVRCGIFGKSRTGRSLREPERFFGKVLGEISGEIVLEKFGEADNRWS